MNISDQANIKTMREAGCSYGQIARVLQMPISTVSSHCLSRGIKPQISADKKIEVPNYCICKQCGKLFVAKINREHSFCSGKCRNTSWRKEKAYQEALEAEWAQQQEYEKSLQKELDFLREESDEWSKRVNTPTVIGVRKLVT